MNKLFFYGLVFAAMTLPDILNAQISPESQVVTHKKKYVAGFSLSEFFNSGLNLNYDRRIGNTRQWMMFDISGYYMAADKDSYQGLGNFLSAFDSFNRYKGFGLGAGYKYFPFKYEFFYVCGGVSYKYFNVRYRAFEYVPFTEDGMSFYAYELVNPKTNNFNRLGANICTGIQSTMRHVFHVNLYAGLGYVYSIHHAREGIFDDGVFGFGHTGVTFIFGFRFGWAFGKVRING